jgi:hypothetical protein
MPRSEPNLDKLVRDILLDVALLKWFATHRRPQAAIMAIELAQAQASPDEQAVLGFLATHIGVGPPA